MVHLDQTSFNNIKIYSSYIKIKRVKSYTSHIKASIVYFSVYHKFIFIYRHNKKRTITMYKIKWGYVLNLTTLPVFYRLHKKKCVRHSISSCFYTFTLESTRTNIELIFFVQQCLSNLVVIHIAFRPFIK